MDACLGTRASEVVHRRLNIARWHVARRLENATEDKGEAYNVAHDKADILIAEDRVEAEYVMQEERPHLLS